MEYAVINHIKGLFTKGHYCYLTKWTTRDEAKLALSRMKAPNQGTNSVMSRQEWQHCQNN